MGSARAAAARTSWVKRNPIFQPMSAKLVSRTTGGSSMCTQPNTLSTPPCTSGPTQALATSLLAQGKSGPLCSSHLHKGPA